MPNKVNKTRKTITIDASGQILGRLASKIAWYLQGKNLPSYRPNTEQEIIVEVKNVHQLKLTGKKAETKTYKSFSGYPGGLKERKFKDLFAKSPNKVLKLAVLRMLPKNRLRSRMIKRLKFI
jgi:large subunit ribosomal protein L13